MTTELREAGTLGRTAPALMRAADSARSGLRTPIGPAAAAVSIAGAFLLASVWAWPVEDVPLTLDVGSASAAVPGSWTLADDPLALTPEGVLAGVVVADNGVAIPVVGVQPGELRDTFGRPRPNERRHSGIDIGAPLRTPVGAAVDGWVYSISNGATGGLGLHMIDRTGRWLLYYAHLDGHAPGLYRGQAVRRGELLGYVGTTGNARGWPHLHFEVGRLSAPGQINARAVNPYDFLLGRLPL